MTASLEIHDLPDTGQIEVRLVEADVEPAKEAAPATFALELSA